MTQSAKRIPEWLTTDLLVIVLSLAIIGICIAITDSAQSVLPLAGLPCVRSVDDLRREGLPMPA